MASTTDDPTPLKKGGCLELGFLVLREAAHPQKPAHFETQIHSGVPIRTGRRCPLLHHYRQLCRLLSPWSKCFQEVCSISGRPYRVFGGKDVPPNMEVQEFFFGQEVFLLEMPVHFHVCWWEGRTEWSSWPFRRAAVMFGNSDLSSHPKHENLGPFCTLFSEEKKQNKKQKHPGSKNFGTPHTRLFFELVLLSPVGSGTVQAGASPKRREIFLRVASCSFLTQRPWAKKGHADFWLLEFKGEPFQRRKARRHRAWFLIFSMSNGIN